jgi:hypothetical protein
MHYSRLHIQHICRSTDSSQILSSLPSTMFDIHRTRQTPRLPNADDAGTPVVFVRLGRFSIIYPLEIVQLILG